MKATADLRKEHQAVLQMLLVLESFLARAGQGQILPIDDLRESVEFLKVFVDRCHHGKEEQLLFPAVRELANPDTLRLVDQLLAEHEEGRGHVTTLASSTGFASAAQEGATQTFPACRPGEEVEYAISGYVALLRPHIAAEQKVLFPLADQILPKEIQEELEKGYQRLEDELIGSGRHEALHSILSDLKKRYIVPAK